MWNRMLAEAVVIAVQTVILIGLCATIGVSGSDRKPEAESGRPLGLDLYQPHPAGNPANTNQGQAWRANRFESGCSRATAARLPALIAISLGAPSPTVRASHPGRLVNLSGTAWNSRRASS